MFPLCLGLLFIPLFALFAQTAAPPKELTIEGIFAEGGLTGRAPETIKWSPDGTKVSFVQRDDSGDHGELWYVDTTTGEKKVLVSEVKLAQLSPPLNKIKDEREKERVALSRRGLHLVARLQAPALRLAGTTLVFRPRHRDRCAAYRFLRSER